MAIKTAGLLLLSVASLIAASADLRLVEAIQNRNIDVARSLLKQHVDVNASQADGATAVAWAAHWDDLETADLLIRAGADVNLANVYGVTPLSLACSSGNAPMVEKLLKAGADARASRSTGETVLMTCAGTGNVEAVKSLLASKADVNAKESRTGQTALMWAAAEKCPEVARVLLDRGADIHARSKGGFTPLLFAARSGDLETARMLLEAGARVNDSAADGMTPLLVASASGHEALSILLLDKGADPNVGDSDGITPLHYALRLGISNLGGSKAFSPQYASYLYRPNMRELAQALLAHGANPNARLAKDLSQLISFQPPFYLGGATPFMIAAAAHDASVMRLMLARGADPGLAMTDNTTPLMAAAGRATVRPHNPEGEKAAMECVKLLVDLGVDVNAVEEDGQTALHIAALAGLNLVVQYLVEHGAKMDVKDRFGQTAFSIAQGVVPANFVGYAADKSAQDKAPYVANRSMADLLRRLGGDIPFTGKVGLELGSGEIRSK